MYYDPNDDMFPEPPEDRDNNIIPIIILILAVAGIFWVVFG